MLNISLDQDPELDFFFLFWKEKVPMWFRLEIMILTRLSAVLYDKSTCWHQIFEKAWEEEGEKLLEVSQMLHQC